MKKIIPIILCSLVLVACEKNEPSSINPTNSSSYGGYGNSNPPTANFSVKTEHPFKVILTNSSQNATSYLWEFGDGQTSTEDSPTHRYTGIGVYKIKLTAKSNDGVSTKESTVTLKAPTSCYISSFVIKKIPTANKYYQIQLTDDYVMSKTTFLYTNWFLLSSANIPYTYNIAPKQISIENTYVMRFYKYTGSGNPSGQASGKGDYGAYITSEQLKTYPESLTWSNTSLEINTFLQWK